MSFPAVVTTEWLARNLDDPRVRIVDIRGCVVTRQIEPGVEEATYRGAPEEYLAGHIPGAVFVDWTRDIVDALDPVPAQIAGPDEFAAAMSARGIGDGTHVVAVDHQGGQFASRLWWALHYHGHDSVSVLEGGFNRWVDEGRTVEAGEVTVEPRIFTARMRPALRVTAEELKAVLGQSGVRVLDARDVGQFSGARRRGPRGGHVPGALNLPRERFFSPGGGWLEPEAVRALATEAGLDPSQRIIAYCNGGVAATVALFQLHRAGFANLANYDGSWNEWGPRIDLPVE